MTNADRQASQVPPVRITNCHVHTFTERHVPSRFVRFPLNQLLKIRPLRRGLFAVIRRFDRGRRGRIARYVQILEVSRGSQEEIFEKVRGFYPRATRFVVLPMDMTHMGAGGLDSSADEQHAELARLRETYPDLVMAFAAADPRSPDVVAKTIHRLEREEFAGIKLYPPLGYHPYDPALWPLYDYASEHGIPVLSHCSRPTNVSYRGPLTDSMRTDPESGELLEPDRKSLLLRFTDPDAYLPILRAHPTLKLCLAHFGGAGDWERYLDDQWISGGSNEEKSWLAKILDMLREGTYPNLYTDIAYTVFANDEYLYLLKVLLSDERIARRVLFGSDFYVVENAELEERRRAVRIRAVLGEELFKRIAEENPRDFLRTRTVASPLA